MKKLFFLAFVFLITPLIITSQNLENISFVSSFHDDVAAIKKGGKWAFINKEGLLIINFRADLVTTKTDQGDYPIFSDNRCKIVEIKDGISYFGFIDKSGKIVIQPQFLNTTNFIDGLAIALKLDKQVTGRNTALGKDMVNYRYFEVLLNTDAEIPYYLTKDGVNVVLDKTFFGGIPQITSKYISENLYAIKAKNKTWTLINI